PHRSSSCARRLHLRGRGAAPVLAVPRPGGSRDRRRKRTSADRRRRVRTVCGAAVRAVDAGPRARRPTGRRARRARADAVTAQTAESSALRVPRVFDSADVPADPQVLAVLERGVSAVDLAARPVVLPDFHHKHDMEMPSSIAVATTGTIRPAFTSASVNCGMALLALDADRPDDGAITAFYRAIAQRYPYPASWR